MILTGLILAVAAGVMAAAAGIAVAYRYPWHAAPWLLAIGLCLLLFRRATSWLIAIGGVERFGFVGFLDSVAIPVAFALLMCGLCWVVAGLLAENEALKRWNKELLERRP